MNEKKITVEFKPASVQYYLDQAIVKWREERDSLKEQVRVKTAALERAEHYIDAFQSVRVSLFGATKP
jgi:hypothetical protein